MSQRHDIVLRLVSHPRYLCVARAAVSTAAMKFGFDDDQCAQIALAVDEAMTNIIRHGYGGREDQPIWLSISPRDGDRGLHIVIEDEGRQVDPATIRGRKYEDVRPGGLGVNIIHEIMDAVRYAPRADRGMRLEMTKACTPRPAAKERKAL